MALATRTDNTKALKSIRISSLILVGESDALMPPASSEEMHNTIVNSEMHTITYAAHMSNLENPNEFNQYLTSFLDKLLD
jgi:pimeloyl-ACP methyl ester carboxylesterase